MAAADSTVAEAATGGGGGEVDPRAVGRRPVVVDDASIFSLDHFFIPHQYLPYMRGVLISHGMIQDRIEKLAADILADYVGRTPHLLCVLKGGHEFFTDLTRAMRQQYTYTSRLDRVPFTFDFVRVKSYEGTESTGKPVISGVSLESLEGRDVILVEDIIDTGATMMALVPTLSMAKSVRVASLLEKRTHRSCGFKADYVGFTIPDAFVVGYNLDYNEAFRELPHLCVINGEGIEKFKDFEKTQG